MSTRHRSLLAEGNGTRAARNRGSIAHTRALLLCLGVLACTLSSIAAGCAPSGGQGGASITLAGSTSVQPFAEMLAEEYARVYPDRPAVNVQGGGSSAGARAALTGAAEIGMMSRGLAESENELTPVVMAKDAIVLVIHPSNPVCGLSREQVRDIFSGKITSWDQVGGPFWQIHVVSREEGSGTRGAFDELVMDGEGVLPRAVVQDSNGAVRETVAGDKAAIGYVSLGLVDQSVKGLSIDGVAPTFENAQEGKYTLVRPFLLVYRGTLAPVAQHFVDYVTGAEGQSILAGEGLVTSK